MQIICFKYSNTDGDYLSFNKNAGCGYTDMHPYYDSDPHFFKRNDICSREVCKYHIISFKKESKD